LRAGVGARDAFRSRLGQYVGYIGCTCFFFVVSAPTALIRRILRVHQ
jgi:hypothetical protein